MKLDATTTIAQFREEMQHRVVKYPLNSRPVREALRYAKSHDDPAFYRIATDKIHAQRQHQRELHGPGKLERLADFFTMGSLREVAVTLVLVMGGVVALDASKSHWPADPDSDLYANMDIDELATRLGIALESGGENRAGQADATSDAKKNDKRKNDAKKAIEEQPLEDSAANGVGRLSDADIARIAEAVIQRLGNRENAKAAAAQHDESKQVKLAENTP